MKKQSERVLPHDLDMETALISALLIDNRGFENIGELQPADFYKPAHGLIFSAMLSLVTEKQPVDLVTVVERMVRKSELEEIGGASYLAKICDSAPVALNAAAYAKKIKDLAMVRGAILSCMTIIDEGYKTTDPEEFISRAQESILSLQTTDTKDHFYKIDDLVIEAISRIKSAQVNISKGLRFGFPVLDNALYIAGSKLIIIAGRPGMGKTALMLSIAKFLALHDVESAILSLEMDKESLIDRLLSEESDINALCFYAKESIGSNSMTDLENAAGRLSYLPMFVDDAGCKIQDIERKCRRAKKLGAKIIFIDQLSKISFPASMTDFQGYTRNCNRIADLKKELRLPIVLLCQISRKLEERVNKVPMLSDLKHTGAIEEDADIVFFVHRPGVYDPDETGDLEKTEIHLSKNRNGATGIERKITFNTKRSMFRMGC
ncbi:MAG TPA: DnaB-like helicase C-terminal domain-containing protein [bacterium]